MGIHKTDTPPKEGMSFNQMPHLVKLGDLNHREPIERTNRILPIRQVTKNKLSDDKWVNGDVVSLQLLRE